jgi:hypothetical protein
MATEFTLFIPKITPESRYVISGPDCQILTVNIPANGTMESEPGAMYVFLVFISYYSL